MKQILITGSTGFLGSALCSYIFKNNLNLDLILLVRANNIEEAKNRLLNSLSRFIDSKDFIKKKIDKVKIIPSDLFGIQNFEDSLKEVTHVLHLAANTSFGNKEIIEKTNVDGTISLCNFLGKLNNIQRFLYVSTATICGDSPNKITNEEDYPQENISHIIKYTLTKTQAEFNLKKFFHQLPTIIVRPSIVVGDEKLGTLVSGSIFWAFRSIDKISKITWEQEQKIDVISSNFASYCLVELLLKNNLKYKIYNISAGEKFSNNWYEISKEFSYYRDDKFIKYDKIKSFEDLDFSFLKSNFKNFFGICDEEFFFKTLNKYYKFAALDTVFNNKRILKEGLKTPNSFCSYIKVCLETSNNVSIVDQMLEDY